MEEDGIILALICEQEKPAEKKCMFDDSAIKDVESNLSAQLSEAIGRIGDAVSMAEKAVVAADNAARIAEVAATRKFPKPPKQEKQDYVMDVVRDDDNRIMRIDVRAI